MTSANIFLVNKGIIDNLVQPFSSVSDIVNNVIKISVIEVQEIRLGLTAIIE